MTFFRNRMFLEGIALGGICGIIIGSIIAFTLGETSIELVRRVMHDRFPRRQGNCPSVRRSGHGLIDSMAQLRRLTNGYGALLRNTSTKRSVLPSATA